MDVPWFDQKTGALNFDEIVVERPSYQKIMQDGVVTPAELQAQAMRVAELFRQLEPLLSPEAKAATTEALCEMSVLYTLTGLAANAAAKRGAQ